MHILLGIGSTEEKAQVHSTYARMFTAALFERHNREKSRSNMIVYQ